MWRWRAQIICVSLMLCIGFERIAAADEKFPIPPEQRAKLESAALQNVGPKMLEDGALSNTRQVFYWATEVNNRVALAKLQPPLESWLKDRTKGVELLSRCFKQECLPIDVLREARQQELVLFLMNRLTDASFATFTSERGALVKGALGQLVTNERELKLPVLTRFTILGDLIDWADNNDDRSMATLVLNQTVKLLPSIAGSVKGRGFGEKSYAEEIFNSQLAALNLYMFLYHSTAERAWLDRAQQIGRVIVGEVLEPEAGSMRWKDGLIDQAITFSSHLALLYHYSGADEFLKASQGVVRAALERVAELDSGQAAEVLRAAHRLNTLPLHITVVGRKSDDDALRLFNTARKIKSQYKRLDWWDQGEGDMMNPDVRFPSLKHAAAFICVEHRCSMPIFTPEQIVPMIQQMTSSK